MNYCEKLEEACVEFLNKNLQLPNMYYDECNVSGNKFKIYKVDFNYVVYHEDKKGNSKVKEFNKVQDIIFYILSNKNCLQTKTLCMFMYLYDAKQYTNFLTEHDKFDSLFDYFNKLDIISVISRIKKYKFNKKHFKKYKIEILHYV